jgi:hypothetical protein
VNSTKQKIANKRRIATVILDDKDCLIHLEIVSCEQQINDLISLLTKNYCVTKVFVNPKEKE